MKQFNWGIFEIDERDQSREKMSNLLATLDHLKILSFTAIWTKTEQD